MDLSEYVAESARQYYIHKEKWLRESLSPFLPDSINKCLDENRHLRLVGRYFASRGIAIHLHQGSRQVEILMCDGKEIARFRWMFS